MLKLSLEKARRILLLGAHSDDIEIGCGGTILSLTKNNPNLEYWSGLFSVPMAAARVKRALVRSFSSRTPVFQRS